MKNLISSSYPELVVMLTYNDMTVENAFEIFEQCKTSKAKYFGFKEKHLNKDEMKRLFKYMKEYNKKTFLEVVAYTEDECLNGAKLALECNCNVLMGTIFFDSVNDFCKKHDLTYMPFVGKISARPSIMEGSIDEIINEANNYIKKGVHGFDLLGYRYTGDAKKLINDFVKSVSLPVCVAGSINSYKRLDEIKEINPAMFTVGSAFFENKFDGTIKEQIDKVYEYVSNNKIV